MFTVIVLKENPDMCFEQFHFLCGQNGNNDEIFWYQWQDGDSISDVVRSLQVVLAKHRTWKLVVWDGVKSFCESEDFMDDELLQFINIVSGKGSKAQQKVMECSYPELIYGMVFCNAQEKDKLKSIRKDPDWDFPQNFRMFLWEIPDGSIADKNENGLCMNCALYLLALNEIPINFLESRTLFKMNIELDMEEFKSSLEEWSFKLKKIEGELERRREQITIAENARVKFSGLREHAGRIWDEKRLEHLINEKSEETNIREYKQICNPFHADSRSFFGEISENFDTLYFDVRKQSTFPRELLENELVYFETAVEDFLDKKGVLSEEETRLLREEQNLILHKIYSIKKLYFNSGERMRILRNWQEKLENYAFMSGVNRNYFYMICIMIVMEGCIILPLFIKVQGDWRKSMPVIAAGIVLICAIILVSNIYRILYSRGRHKLNALIDKWNGERDGVRDYLKKLLSMIMQYQFYEKCRKNSEEHHKDIRRQKENLELHKKMLMEKKILCEKMLCMAEEAETVSKKAENGGTVFINECPDEYVYGLIREKDRRALAEFNGSGHFIKAGYKFVRRVFLDKVRDFSD